MSGERLYWSIMGPIVALLFMLGCWGLYETPAHAQNPDLTIAGIATNRSTVLAPAVVTTGLTYQILLPAVQPSNPAATGVRKTLIIESNTVSTGALTSDICYVLVGTPQIASQIVAGTTTTSTNLTGLVNGSSVTATAAQWSFTFSGGGSYTRTFPYVLSDPIYVTCATAGDSVIASTE